MVKYLTLGKTYIVDTHWNCLYEAIPMYTNNLHCILLKIRKLVLSLHLNLVPCPMSLPIFKHLKLPISIRIPVTTPQIV